MRSIAISPVSPTSAAFDSAALLFDQYRQFYGQPAQAQMCRQFLINRLSSGESIVLLATVDGEAAGIVQLYHGFSSIACTRTTILNDLFVSPNHRSSGVGRQLVEAAIRCAKTGGAACIQLETAQDNIVAQRLYEGFGFKLSSGFLSYALNLDVIPDEA